MILRCTKKLLNELGLTKTKLVDITVGAGQPPLYEWYAHLFYFNRRKCVMFTNAGSLFSFAVFDVLKKDIKNTDELFRKELSRAMYDEDFNGEQIKNPFWAFSGCRVIAAIWVLPRR